MNHQKMNKSKKSHFLASIVKYRVKIFLGIFFIVLPLTLITLLYTQTYSQSKNIYFDQTIQPETVFIRTFQKPDELDEFDLLFDWLEYRVPKENPAGELENGYYTLSLQYVPKGNFNLTQVHATVVLQVPWTSYRSVTVPTQIFSNPRYFFIPFNFDLPANPLWFVRVTDPIMYIKLDYQYQSASTFINKTAYISIDLRNFQPDRVVPAS